jgi:hypothetical protein
MCRATKSEDTTDSKTQVQKPWSAYGTMVLGQEHGLIAPDRADKRVTTDERSDFMFQIM